MPRLSWNGLDGCPTASSVPAAPATARSTKWTAWSRVCRRSLDDLMREGAVAVTRRQFLTRVAAVGGGSLAYEAMTGLGLLAAPSQAPFNLAGRVSGVRVVIL